MKYYRWLLIVWTLRVSLACDDHRRVAVAEQQGEHVDDLLYYHQYYFPNLMDGLNLVRD